MKILLSCTDIVLKEISVYLHMNLQLWVLYMTYCMVRQHSKFSLLVQFHVQLVSHELLLYAR